MNTRQLMLLILCAGTHVYGHGRSPEMIAGLNASAPGWMYLARPIPLEVIEDEDALAVENMRGSSGGAVYWQRVFRLPGSDVEWKVDYDISHINGVSVSPDGNRVIVNSGVTPHLYRINADGNLTEEELIVPHVTYDAGPKGFISGWVWAGNDRLLGHASINDEQGHTTLEERLYLFDLNGKGLARLDVSALAYQKPPDILEVEGIAGNSGSLRLSVGGRKYWVRVNLMDPLVPVDQADAGNRKSAEGELSHPTFNSVPRTIREGMSEERKSGTIVPWWVTAAVLLVALVVSIAMLWKGRKL